MKRAEDKCPYCDTEFMVEFENDDDELVYCPSCGEELPSFEEDDLSLEFDDWY
jgi:uncharacterized Zn-finger protein